MKNKPWFYVGVFILGMVIGGLGLWLAARPVNGMGIPWFRSPVIEIPTPTPTPAATGTIHPTPASTVSGPVIIPTVLPQVPASVYDAAVSVLQTIRDGNWEALAQTVHPANGVRFSMYAYVNVNKDVVLTADEIRGLGSSSKTYTWGALDGSGDPYTKTIKDYLATWVYNEDYASAGMIGINTVIGQGSVIENTAMVYPTATFVEFYFPGKNPEYGGMDWYSLKVVMEKVDDTWKLVGLVNNRWTT